MEFCPSTMPTVIKASEIERMFEQSYQLLFGQKYVSADDEVNDVFAGQFWNFRNQDREVNRGTAMMWAQDHYDLVQDSPLIQYGWYHTEKPCREGDYARVLGFHSELGERIYLLARHGIDWNLKYSKPNFKTSVENMLSTIKACEYRADLQSIENIESSLRFWRKEFPHIRIGNLLHHIDYVYLAVKAKNKNILWDSRCHCADKNRTLNQAQQILKCKFDDTELKFVRNIIAHAYEYWPDDSEVSFCEDDITLTLLSRYFYDGAYNTEPQGVAA